MKTLIGLLLALACASSQATVVQVFSPAGLSPGPFTLEDFEDNAFQPGFTATSATGTRIFAGGGTSSGINGLTTNDFPDPITLSFTTPASSVGLFFGNDDTCCSNGFSAFMDIFDANGLVDTIGVVANMNDAVDQFLGFVSDNLVTKVTVRYGSGTNVGLFTYVDDLQFNVASQTNVPEPGALSLVGAGLLGLGAARRRRARA